MSTNMVAIEELPVVREALKRCQAEILQLTGLHVMLTIANEFINIQSEGTVQQLQVLICKEFDVQWNDIRGRSRKRPVVDARHTFMFLAHKNLGLSQNETGSECGERDHTTVINACKKIKGFYQTGDKLVERVERVKEAMMTFLNTQKNEAS